jgi:hypothetical protein
MIFSKQINKIVILHIFLGMFLLFNSCGLYKKTDQRGQPSSGIEKARKNLEEGKGISLKNLRGGKGTTYEFSTSNPMWRASLEILDFIPLLTVDYSGGIIISDWYSTDSNSNESIKITVRFFNNEIATGNLKVIVHQKKCLSSNNCSIVELKSKIKEELTRNILAKAAILKVESKKKK